MRFVVLDGLVFDENVVVLEGSVEGACRDVEFSGNLSDGEALVDVELSKFVGREVVP